MAAGSRVNKFGVVGPLGLDVMEPAVAVMRLIGLVGIEDAFFPLLAFYKLFTFAAFCGAI